MTVGTTRLHEKNAELFARLSQEMRAAQAQVGSGLKDLRLSKNLHEIARLSAAEEKKAELQQYTESSKRAFLDLEVVDLTLDRAQNLLMKLNEMSVQSTNDVLNETERQMFSVEARAIKDELFSLANQEDSFGNSIFGGISGKKKPFLIDKNGNVSFVGSGIPKQVKVGSDAFVNQNLSGQDVFQNLTYENQSFSIFELVDDYIASLDVDLSSSRSNNLFSDATSVDLVFPSSDDEATVEFKLDFGNTVHSISSKVYGNDYSVIASEINKLTAATGLSASVTAQNRLRLQKLSGEVHLENFKISNFAPGKAEVKVIKDIASSNVVDKISEDRLRHLPITRKINEAFTHFSTVKTEIGAYSRRAQENQTAAQDMLLDLEDNIADLRDADLAELLTKLEFLMTNKEAAQATFTRITSKSLFDFLG